MWVTLTVMYLFGLFLLKKEALGIKQQQAMAMDRRKPPGSLSQGKPSRECAWPWQWGAASPGLWDVGESGWARHESQESSCSTTRGTAWDEALQHCRNPHWCDKKANTVLNPFKRRAFFLSCQVNLWAVVLCSPSGVLVLEQGAALTSASGSTSVWCTISTAHSVSMLCRKAQCHGHRPRVQWGGEGCIGVQAVPRLVSRTQHGR